ncbi:hypothetical protein ATE80_01730 [Streptomyces kanasensis]|uniref:Uncharacterized protein n=1 Tax=Streptomyces kanasensis TaxID=936756 RepID=A0A124EDC5_9ACTN|nr:hypothetical protein ATE80_01730 [Streptomyces kanasensis]
MSDLSNGELTERGTRSVRATAATLGEVTRKAIDSTVRPNERPLFDIQNRSVLVTRRTRTPAEVAGPVQGRGPVHAVQTVIRLSGA